MEESKLSLGTEIGLGALALIFVGAGLVLHEFLERNRYLDASNKSTEDEED